MAKKRLFTLLLTASSLVLLVGCKGEGIDWEGLTGWRDRFFVEGGWIQWYENLWIWLTLSSFGVLWRIRKGTKHDIKEDLVLGVFTREALYYLVFVFWMWFFPVISTWLGQGALGDLDVEQAWQNMGVSPEFSLEFAVASWSTVYIVVLAFVVGAWQRALIWINIFFGMSAFFASPLKLWKKSLAFFLGWLVWVIYLMWELRIYAPQVLGEDPDIASVIPHNATFIVTSAVLGFLCLILLPVAIAFFLPDPDNYEVKHHEEWRYPNRIVRKEEAEVRTRWEMSDEMTAALGAAAGAVIGGMMSDSGSSRSGGPPPPSPQYPNGNGRNGGPPPSPTYDDGAPGLPSGLPEPVDEDEGDDSIETDYEWVERPDPSDSDESRPIPMGPPKRERRRPRRQEEPPLPPMVEDEESAPSRQAVPLPSNEKPLVQRQPNAGEHGQGSSADHGLFPDGVRSSKLPVDFEAWSNEALQTEGFLPNPVGERSLRDRQVIEEQEPVQQDNSLLQSSEDSIPPPVVHRKRNTFPSDDEPVLPPMVED